MVRKTATQARTPEEAVKEMIDLHDRYKEKPEGERLTHPIIQQGVGVSQAPTISRWFNKHNQPTGLQLRSLCEFLDKARNKKWLEKFIKENDPKGSR